MIIELNSLIPLMTIIGAATAPVISQIWAEGRRARDAKDAARFASIAAMKVAEVKSTLVHTAAVSDAKLDEVHKLVNDQLTQAVSRFDAATAEIAELKLLVGKLQSGR